MLTSYGVKAAAAMAALLLVAGLWCRRERIGYGPWIRLCVLGLPLAFVLSRLLFALTALGSGDVFSSPVQALYFWDGGASVTGAFAGVVIAAALVEHMTRTRHGVLLDGVALGAPVSLIIERLSEPAMELGIGRYVDTEGLAFLGSLTDGRHPVYLYEAVLALAIGVVLACMVLRRRGVRHPGDLLLTFLTLYGTSQVVMESLRDDAHMVIYFIRINQIAALLMAVTAFVLWVVRWVRRGAKKPHVAVCCILVLAAIAQGVVQEFAVDSNPNLLLEYGIMVLCMAVMAAVTLTVRRLAE
ncbi:MAG: prolipoprotein diacylglyceryl transferase family protein [Aristaeellaceae bacterium]